MLSRRIIFLLEDSYSNFQHHRLGIDTLEKRGFSVEFWDCSKIFRPQFQGAQQASDVDGFSGLRNFEKKSHLLDKIIDLTSQDTLLTMMGLSIETFSVLRHISRTKALWGTMRLGALPTSPGERHFRSRIEKFIRRPFRAVNFLFQKLPPTKLGLRHPDFILVGGTAPLGGGFAHMNGPNTKILDVHSFDYDRHLQTMSEKEEVTQPTSVVFLDHGGPFHRDLSLFNIPFPCSVEEYFSNLNSFFRLVEKKNGCSVVVAGHPRVDYKKEGNPFEGRKIIQGAIQKCVKNAIFAISFSSTSVSFAVIYKKPVLFLALNPNKRNAFDPKTKSIATKLGKSQIYWTGKGDIDWDRELMVDQSCYEHYMETYIKSRSSPERLCWEVFADYLTTISD
jgi:hypothetical protein